MSKFNPLSMLFSVGMYTVTPNSASDNTFVFEGVDLTLVYLPHYTGSKQTKKRVSTKDTWCSSWEGTTASVGKIESDALSSDTLALHTRRTPHVRTHLLLKKMRQLARNFNFHMTTRTVISPLMNKQETAAARVSTVFWHTLVEAYTVIGTV